MPADAQSRANACENGKILVARGESYQVVAGHMGLIAWKSAELGHL